MNAVLSEAQKIVESARKRAGELTAQAEHAYQEAKTRGYQDGVIAGEHAVAEKAVRLIEESTTISDTLSLEAARLAIAISSTVIGEHVKVSPETVMTIAKKALQESIIGELVTIICHPDDHALLSASAGELRRVAGGAKVLIEST